MNTIQQTVTIPANRRLHLDVPLPETIPVGQAEVLVIVQPAQKAKEMASVRQFAGCLAGSATFAGDPVVLQRAMRDEW